MMKRTHNCSAPPQRAFEVLESLACEAMVLCCGKKTLVARVSPIFMNYMQSDAYLFDDNIA
jgi:hypothetical protein